MMGEVETNAKKMEAQRLYVPHVFGLKRVAAQLGVSHTTVKRWIDPQYDEVIRRDARKRKSALRGVCEKCGAETRYGGQPNSGPLGISRLCTSCGEKRSREITIGRRGHGEKVGRVLVLLQSRDMRFMEIADALGVGNNYVSQLLDRLLKYGLIERPQRGLYRISNPPND